jgi:D-alanyl-D-alanine carboxypeptidase
LLYDVQADRTCASSSPEKAQPIASLAKLMTAILAVERLRFDGMYVLTEDEQAVFDTKALSARQMLELMLVPSNNAACRVVARIAAGDERSFVQLMNARAELLGLARTRFVNATGLPGAGQYSTPADVLRLFLAALSCPAIARAITLHEVELNGKRYPSTLAALYKRHPGLLAGKTGYTRAAGRCLVLYYRSVRPAAPERGQPGRVRDYVLVVLGSQGIKESFRDAELLLKQYGLFNGEVAAWD